jgi:hypothetical protein
VFVVLMFAGMTCNVGCRRSPARWSYVSIVCGNRSVLNDDSTCVHIVCARIMQHGASIPHQQDLQHQQLSLPAASLHQISVVMTAVNHGHMGAADQVCS